MRSARRQGRVWLMVFVAGAPTTLACGPVDDRTPCEKAQDSLNEAYEECEIDARIDLSCNAIMGDGDQYDCAEYYGTVAETARCEDGEVTFEYGGPCE